MSKAAVDHLPNHEVGFVYLVSPKGHPIYTLTNFEKEPCTHSPITVIQTLFHVRFGVSEIRGTLLGVLLIRESYYLGVYFRVPSFREPPI